MEINIATDCRLGIILFVSNDAYCHFINIYIDKYINKLFISQLYVYNETISQSLY